MGIWSAVTFSVGCAAFHASTTCLPPGDLVLVVGQQDGQLLTLTGQMPLRTDLPTTYADYFAANPDYKLFADQAARTVEVPNTPNSMEIWQTFRDAWTSAVIFGKSDVQQTLTDAATKIDQLAKS